MKQSSLFSKSFIFLNPLNFLKNNYNTRALLDRRVTLTSQYEEFNIKNICGINEFCWCMHLSTSSYIESCTRLLDQGTLFEIVELEVISLETCNSA
ncbi:hypothetical protein HanRHA438_Chr12g0564701 [Helianthus annuus]|nr:hypothetical protein HanRHA438_Chr12g0564701 [Helianthus annuus]